MSSKNTTPTRGRPRGFDETTAIEAAMRVFWAHGYAAASVDNLCSAMHMPRASLYQMFGDKEGLFMATLKHYRDVSFAPVMKLLNGGGDLRSDLTAFLNGVIEFATHDPETPGCLIACVLADAAGVNMRFRDDLTFKFDQIEKALADRVGLAQCDGDIQPEPSAQDIGVMLAATARGLMVRARTGCKASDMYPAAKAAVDLCLRS